MCGADLTCCLTKIFAVSEVQASCLSAKENCCLCCFSKIAKDNKKLSSFL